MSRHSASRSVRVSTGIVLLVHLTLPVQAQGAIDDPVPDQIVKSGLSVKIVDFVQVPASSSSPPMARINLLYHSRDNTGALFVNDLRGELYVIDSGTVITYLDIASLHPNFVDTPGLGTGFGCFAFHPDFATNGIFYTVHSEGPGFFPPDLVSTSTVGEVVQSVIKEWTADVPLANVFTGTVREILRIAQPSFLHAVQEIGFSPNANPGDADYGMLYIAQGDGEDFLFSDNPQNLSSPHGAILRIDPLGTNSPNGAYGIPADNPFANDGDSNTLGEIWAYGFRNPHRFSWDTDGDGKMLIGEIGQANVEEVNLGKVGANYGWNEREGTFQFDKNNTSVLLPLPTDDATLGFTYPVAQYDHDEAASVGGFVAIVGGFVYRGTKIPSLFGKYIFGDIVSGRIFYVDVADLVEGSQATILELTLLDESDLEITLLDLVPGSRVDLRFGIGQDGEIYVLSKADGKVRRLVATESGNALPVLAPIGDQTVAEGVTLAVAVSASDPDGDALTLSAQNLPFFATFTDNGNGTGVLDLNPGFGDTAIYNGVTITVDDGSATDAEILTITVVVTDPSLAGHWTLDEGSGTTATYSSSNGNHGTLTNMDLATDWIAGEMGGALDFDGTDDYLSLGSADVLNPGTSDFTVMTWIKMNPGAATDKSVFAKQTDLSPGWNFNIDGDTQPGGIELNVSDGSLMKITGQTDLRDGIWHHVAIMKIGADRTNWKLYQDGVSVAFTEGHGDGVGGSVSNSAPVYIGRRHWPGSPLHFQGALDDVRFYTRALSDSEMLEIYLGSPPPPS